MKDIIIGIAITGFGYPLLLLVRPLRRCPRCKGRKVEQYLNGGGYRPCRRCRAQGKAYRPGAIIMQRLVIEHIWPWIRDRVSDAIDRRTDAGMQDRS